MAAYYNENDPAAAQWLRNLIAAGHIAPGEVDERSILEVQPSDLAGFTQCHFFAGIGVWSYSLRSAGWPDDRPVWTGSCPCQPFSAAGKGNEFADERHLWPAWFRLARELRPDTIFGEQVSSKDALTWFDHVRSDLEGEGYALGVLDTCAAGVGAPHIRQRLFFVADSDCGRFEQRNQGKRPVSIIGPNSGADSGRREDQESLAEGQQSNGVGSSGNEFMGHPSTRGFREPGSAPGQPGQPAQPISDCGVGNSERIGGWENVEEWSQEGRAAVWRPSASGSMADSASGHAVDGELQRGGKLGLPAPGGSDDGAAEGDQRPAGPVNGFWSGADWVWCRDPGGSRWRPAQSRLVALADGPASGMESLRTEEKGEMNGKVHGGISEISGASQTELRGVRDGQAQIARPPQGRESAEQRSIKFADFVRLLPQTGALAQLYGDTHTAETVRALLEGCGKNWSVQHAPDSAEEIWRSLGKEDQDRICLGFKQGRWMTETVFPLEKGSPSRVIRLRAFGNAIVAPVAIEFIQAYREVRGF